MATPLSDLSRLCLHTITTKPWSIDEAAKNYAAAGVKGITVWRQAIESRDPAEAGRMIRGHGLSISSLCRGGFFTGSTKETRSKALDENRRCLDEAAALGAPLVVLVCGATPGQPLEESRRQIAEAVACLADHAAAAKVRLAIEPLHPMYADERSAINTVEQARVTCSQVGSPWVGIAIDVYHVWWDDSLEREIAACGADNRLFAFHMCDWRTPTTDMLNDRGLMGEGCIPVRQIRGWMERAGFAGFNEVEIFSQRRWAGDQGQFLAEIRQAYLDHG
jgi:sugar phosphate isomerase/epimerase